MSAPTTATAPTSEETSGKGLGAGQVGLLGAVVIGLSCIAPAYTLSASLGPAADAVGYQLPAVFLAGFIPMLLVAVGYRHLNRAMPDAGTTFTWTSTAFGPWIGWMGGWGLLAATILVLSNLAGIAVDFFYLAISVLFSNPAIADLAQVRWINIVTCLAFMAAACWISYRGMETTKAVQYVLVAFQLLVLILFSVMGIVAIVNGDAVANQSFSWQWFNPFELTFSQFAAGIAVTVFVYWGWDVVLTINEETKGSATTPGKAATATIFTIVLLYMAVGISSIGFAGAEGLATGLGDPALAENVFAALAGPVMGPLAILMYVTVLSSSFASLQSTFVSPARTLLAMGHYKALSPKYAQISRRYQSPGYATLAAAVVSAAFYVVMRIISEDALWDTISALGMMVCFYYGVTALACVWYFRRTCTRTVGTFLSTCLAPLTGGILLLVFFVQTAVDSTDPEFGSGSEVGGIGLVFVLGIGVLALGLVAMVYQYLRRPEFFRKQTITPRHDDAS